MKDPSGDKRTPSVCIPIELSTHGIGVEGFDLPEVITS